MAVDAVGLLVDEFLRWPLPDSVCCDPCACTPGYPHRSGTNLLTANQARAMFEHLLGKLPRASSRIERAATDALAVKLAAAQAELAQERERADKAEELAKRSTARLVEMSDPGFIGAFAARDHWQERAQAAEARVEECERIITAMTQWLDQQQPDVFRRGLWDAIAEGKKP